MLCIKIMWEEYVRPCTGVSAHIAADGSRRVSQILGSRTSSHSLMMGAQSSFCLEAYTQSSVSHDSPIQYRGNVPKRPHW